MHIPDGYLSPQTCGVMYVAATPFWMTAARRVRRIVKHRHVPLLAIMAAYCFLVMMFNVPIPDGTTAHAVGAVLVAVLLGPWAAIVAVSVALATQALFFGDGGVLAFGANSFNMAIVMPLAGYGVYLVLSRHLSLTSPRRAAAAGVGAYVGLNAAALCAAVELGLQPALFHRADGTPLYAPFHLWQSIPAMLLAHGLVAGPVELVLTAGVVAYLQRANLGLLRINPDNRRGEREPASATGAPRPAGVEQDEDVNVSSWWWGVGALVVMAVLTPLGLLAPGEAFGEARPSQLDLREYHLERGALRVGALRRVLAQRPVQRLRLRPRPASGRRLPGVRRRRPGRHRGRHLRRAGPRPGPAAPPVRAPDPLVAHRGVGMTTGAGGSRPTPAWLLADQPGMCPCGCIGRRRQASYVDKTIQGGTRLLRQTLFADDVASRPGLLQRIEPRVKLVSLAGLLVAASLLRHLPVLAAVYALTLVLAVASGLSLAYFVKRVWLFIPVFTGIVVLPATLSIVTPGRIVVPLGHWWFGQAVGITAQGLAGAALLVTRVAVSISLVVLLTLTTRWDDLLASMRGLFVPRIFVAVLAMCYRYLFVLLGTVDDMYLARRARVAGDGSLAGGRAYVAATAGSLFSNAHALSEEVHQAMVARGYTGDARTLRRRSPVAADWVWLVASVATVAAVLGADRVLGR